MQAVADRDVDQPVLPTIGTAGFDRMWVRGNSRVPWPPPRINASTSLLTAIANNLQPSTSFNGNVGKPR